jgi:peptidoglycan/xylan/chitin deacetylase (PgdA/CDA1 family)
VDRRKFLKRLGLGGAGVVGVSAPVGTYVAGRHLAENQILGDYAASVVAGERRGHTNVWWSVQANRKVLALTFDDGPTEQFTNKVLDVLDSYHVPASFFLIGEMIGRRPDDVRRSLEAGHELANHTFDHYSAMLQTPDEVRRTMERGADAVAAVLGHRPRWFRPVKGHVTGAVLNSAAELHHDLAVWSYGRGPAAGSAGVLADDDIDGVRNYLSSSVFDGAIVILHDGIGRSAWEWSGPDDQLVAQRTTEVQALPAVIENYLAEGYEFVTISELIDTYGTA